MRNYWFVVLVVFIAFTRCGKVVEKDLDSSFVKKWYYKNGVLKKTQEYSSDTVANGTYNFFYENGVLMDSAYIIDGSIQGERVIYYPNGNRKKNTIYKDNSYRWSISFYENGLKEFYRAYDYGGNLLFLIHYDEIKSIQSIEGKVIYSWVQEKNYSVGEKIKFEFLIATPPNCDVNVNVYDWGKLNLIEELKPDINNKVSYSSNYDFQDEIIFLHVANVLDSIGSLALSDSLFITINKEGESSYFRPAPCQMTNKE